MDRTVLLNLWTARIGAYALPLALGLGAVLPANGQANDCTSPSACLHPAQFLTASQAREMRRGLGKAPLLVDIRNAAERRRVAPIAIDAHVPYLEDEGGAAARLLFFRQDFRDNMDGFLRKSGVKHDHPVVLLARTRQLGEMAALNLQEHGFSRIYVMTDEVDGWLPAVQR